MTTKLSAVQSKQASEILGRVDALARDIQANYKSWGMSLEGVRPVVNNLDKIADALEERFFGLDSLQRRQVEVLKQAHVIQQDSDESYMASFNGPSSPKQTDADEPYMSAYADDQTQAVRAGKSTSGRPLA